MVILQLLPVMEFQGDGPPERGSIYFCKTTGNTMNPHSRHC